METQKFDFFSKFKIRILTCGVELDAGRARFLHIMPISKQYFMTLEKNLTQFSNYFSETSNIE